MNAVPPLPHARTQRPADVEVEFDGFTVEAIYHMEGHHYAATETSPEEWPVAIVDEARIRCGDFTVCAPFDLLAESVRDGVLDAITDQEEDE